MVSYNCPAALGRWSPAPLRAKTGYATLSPGDCMKLPRVDHFFDPLTPQRPEPKSCFTLALRPLPTFASEPPPVAAALATNVRLNPFSWTVSIAPLGHAEYRHSRLSRPTPPRRQPSPSRRRRRLPLPCSKFRLVDFRRSPFSCA
jgi:hypothetical protein